MSFSTAVKEQALLACERHCCLCHTFCGIKMECHHIEQEAHGGQNTVDNCIPLCLNCHADVANYNPQHPKGTKYTASELRQRRDTFYAKIARNGGATANAEYIEIDRQLFAELKAKLPSSGAISYIRVHNFAAPFNLSHLDEMYDFPRWADKSENEFFDTDLESVKANIIDSIQEFRNCLGINTFHLNQIFNHVPPEWEYEQPDRYKSAVTELNSLSDQVCERYDALIRLARRRLKVR